MDCRDLDRSIDAFWDRALPREAARRVEEHLAACLRCADRYGPVTELLAARPAPVPVPAELRARIVAEVAGQPVSSLPYGRGSDAGTSLSYGRGSQGGTSLPHGRGSERRDRGWKPAPVAKPFSPVWSGLIAACVTLLAAGGLAWHVAGRHSETQVADVPPEAVPTVARAEPPDPALLSGWVHAAVLPAPVRPMALVAHLAAMEELARASDALVSIQIPRRPLRGDIPPLEPAAPPPEFLMPWSRLAL